MSRNPYIDEIELRKAIAQLKPNNQLFEVRVLGSKAYSGYFTDVDIMLAELEQIFTKGATAYITLNAISYDLYSRKQRDTFLPKTNNTADDDVDGYEWLFIDLDPVRTTGISSTDEELNEAKELMIKIHDYMDGLGFNRPVVGLSGNGYHLLYKIQLANTDDNRELIHNCLAVLSDLFSTDKIEIDKVNYNPSRICKLYGTLAQKGADSKERPHRMSKILGDVIEAKVNDRMYLEKLSNELPREIVPPSKENNYHSKEFDIEEWMDTYGIGWKHGGTGRDSSTIYRLDHCPFNHNHENGDAKIFRYADGRISFKCQHKSCLGKKWQDVRTLFEPNAYNRTDDDRRIEDGWRKHNRDKAEQIHYEECQAEIDNEPLFLTAEMIRELNEPEGEYIQSGIKGLDKRLKGLQKGRISVLSGLRGAAKSTILSGIILNAITYGQTSICYSGELSKKGFMKWMYMQAAGKGKTRKYEKFDSYYCPQEYEEPIAKWMGEYFWLYNNNYGNDFNKISQVLRKEITDKKADLCIVDNLMALDLSKFSEDKYEAQTKFVWELKDIAESCNVHIIFVAHPRKSQGFLRLDDISGSGNIANIVDNAFIIHRNNDDFKRLTKQMYQWKDDNPAYLGTNVIEICKDRENGTQDVFVPLYFEPETKRLKNSPDEHTTYGWEDFDKLSGEDKKNLPF